MPFFHASKVFEAKLKERNAALTANPEYSKPLTEKEVQILDQLAETTITQIKDGQLEPIQVVRAYEKEIVKAQEKINCVTEVLFEEAEKMAKDVNKSLPLAGFPISLKDTNNVAGYDSTMGYAKHAFKPAAKDSPLVRLLKDAGGIPIVKTNVPMTLLSLETYNDMWGTTENPHKKGFGPGGSTGGEAALIAFGGSRFGIGTDVAGSVRMPAHSSGIYSLKCSTRRFPEFGSATPQPGEEGIPSVYSPMCRTLEDLSFFLKTIIGMKPWNYDCSVVPLPWTEYTPPEKMKIGVWWSDGMIRPSPACTRALKMVADAFAKQGHEVVDFEIPDPVEALKVGSQLLNADAGKVALTDLTFFENNDAGFAGSVFYQRLPWIIRKVFELYVRYIRGDALWADLLSGYSEKTAVEIWELTARREDYRALVFEHWKKSGIDALITVPNATPALPHKGLVSSFSSCLYTFMFNIVDYSAGILPVTKVDAKLDQLPADFKPMNTLERGAYNNYDATKMEGLPVGVEIVGGRMQEEKTLAIMKVAQESLKKNGVSYELLPVN